MHHERMFDNQELPKKVNVIIANTLENVGIVNGFSRDELMPNCLIETFEGSLLPAVWYPHTGIPKSERRSLEYKNVDFYGKPKEYSILPSGWVLTENHWFPLVARLLRVVGAKELLETPDLLDRVLYNGYALGVEKSSILNGGVKLLASLGAAENPYYIAYLSTNKHGDLLPSETKNNWLIHDTKNVGYKACGIGKRVYGPGCYFGGSWVCADKSSAKGVDSFVCKTKSPPWPTRYFWAIIDDVVYNAGEGSSIKAGRIRLLNEDQPQDIPDWVRFP